MSYIHYHTLQFNNRITGDVQIKMYKKDGDAEREPDELICTNASRSYLNGDGDKFDTIIASELTFGIWLPLNSIYTYDDFLVSFHDEWKVELYNEDNLEFVGFLIPSEGDAAFRDLPYDVQLSATDGLGFLKNDSLTNNEGGVFSGVTTILDYLVGALAKTRLQLNVRTYCSIYAQGMNDRIDGIRNDMFNQAKLDYRTFQNDDNSMVDCYKALTIMLEEGFSIFQWFGKWVVVRIGELQGTEGPKLYYTEYDHDGVDITAELEGYDPAIVAKDQTLHPINADQRISSMFAIKFAKHTYNYTAWPELPANNKFDRGNGYEEGPLVPGPGTYKKYTIDNWLYGVTNPSVGSTQPPNGMLSTTDHAYRYSEYDIFGIERMREIRLERDIDPQPGHRFLRGEGVPVKAGGRIRINVDYKSSAAGTGTRQYLMVMLERSSGVPFRLDQPGGAPSDGIGTLVWSQTTAMRFLAKNYITGDDAGIYSSFNIEPPPLPVDGTLYILFMAFDPPIGRIVYYKNFSLEYIPYVAGGYVQVKGDSWKSEQEPDYKDVVNQEVYISDSPEKIFKGALLLNDGVTLIPQKTWYRINVNEQRDFKELINMARFNHAYRRMRRITGTFGGTTWHPYNGNTSYEPLGFHRHFKFVDDPDLSNKSFMLVPPLTIDYAEGEIKATFVEAYDSTTNDGNEEGTTHEFKFNFG